MQRIDSITGSARQLFKIALPDQTVISFELTYRPRIQRWTVSITYLDFVVENVIVCVHPNFMRAWKNLIPFGIACATTDRADPVFIEDFANERATLYVLTQDEVEQIEDSIFGATE